MEYPTGVVGAIVMEGKVIVCFARRGRELAFPSLSHSTLTNRHVYFHKMKKSGEECEGSTIHTGTEISEGEVSQPRHLVSQ